MTRASLQGILAAVLGMLVLLGILGIAGCDRGPTESPTAPAQTLLDTQPASLEQLCAEAPRAWAVLDPDGSIVAVTRGDCLGRVEHPEDGPLWHLVAQLQAGDAEPSWELHTWIDPSGEPRHAELRTPTLVTHYSWRDDALAMRRLGDQREIADAGGLWVTPNHALYLREVMLRLGVVTQRGLVPEQDGREDHISTLALELVRTDDDRAEARSGASVLALDGASAGLAGLQIGPVVAGDALVYRPLSSEPLVLQLPAVPRPRYVAPAELTLTPIEIPGDKAGAPKLAGELTFDPSVGEDGERPAVLFLAGAGAQDRHGIVPGSSVDLGSHELHDALARAGFVVLRFDDRGVGASEVGDEATPGFRTLVDDGRRALALLASRPEIDPAKIVVIGHGEGALQASILAAERVRARGRKLAIAGLVLLAGPGRNLRELVYDEIRTSLAGHRDAEIRTVVQRAQLVHDAALADEDLPASSESARQWMIEAFAEDPLARLAKVRAPILAVQGGKDFQVSPERDFGPIRALVEARSSNGSAAELFPELDHLFKLEPSVSTPGHYADLRRRVDVALIERVVAWATQICG